MNDTAPAIAKKQIELLRAAGPQRRVALALSLSQSVIDLSRRALRRRMPDASKEELGLAFVELHYGSEVADMVRRARQ